MKPYDVDAYKRGVWDGVTFVVIVLCVIAVIVFFGVTCVGCSAVAPITLPVVQEAHTQALAIQARLAEIIGWLRWAIVALGGDLPSPVSEPLATVSP